MLIDKHTGHQIGPQDSFKRATRYFLENPHLLEQDLSKLQTLISGIFGSGGSPFTTNTKEKNIIIPEYTSKQWNESFVILGCKKIVLEEVLHALHQNYSELLPNFAEVAEYSFATITSSDMIALISDILALMNAGESLTRKRGTLLPRTFTYKGVRYGDSKENMQTESRKTDIIEATNTIEINSVDDVVNLLNQHPIPLTISQKENCIKITSSNIKRIQDLCIDTTNRKGICHIKDILQACITKRPQFFSEYTQAIEKGVSKEQSNKAFLTCFVKLYLIKKGTQLKIIDTKGKLLPWIGNINIKTERKTPNEILHKTLNNVVSNYESKKHPMKHKISKNIENDKKVVDKDLFMSLGYSSSFATKLYKFCCISIMMQINSTFTVEELAHHRNLQTARDIKRFHDKSDTRSLILALDNILDHYLIDKHTGYKERTHRGHL